MDQTDFAYLAGFLDGEGTFTVYRSGKTYNALVSAASNDQGIIGWLQSIFGGNTYAPEVVGNRAQGYQWQIRDKEQLIDLLPRLAPYLKIKALQARLLLKYCLEFREHHRGQRLTAEDLEVRGAYCTLFADLNATGRESAETKAAVVDLFRTEGFP